MVDLSLSLVTHLVAVFGVGMALGAVAGGVISAVGSFSDTMKGM